MSERHGGENRVAGLRLLGTLFDGTRVYELGGGWVREVKSTGEVSDTYKQEYAQTVTERCEAQREWERERRQAWDLYASAVLNSQMRYHESTAAVDPSEARRIADEMLLARDCRFPKPS